MIRIKNTSNVLTLKAENEVERKSDAVSRSDFKSHRRLFSESLDMNFKGSVYHPKFMEFDASLGINPRQLDENNGTTSRGRKFRHELLNKYYFNTTLLKEKPVTGIFFVNREEDVSNRDFFERQTTDIFSFGERVVSREAWLPLTVSHQRTSQDIRRSFRPGLYDEKDLVHWLYAPRLPRVGDVKFDLSREQYRRQEEGFLDQAGTADNFSASNRYAFGADNENELFSGMHYYHLADRVSNDDLTLNENLTVNISDSLKSIAGYSLFDHSSSAGSTRQNSAAAGLRHQLFESLTSAADVKGSVFNTPSYDETRLGVVMREDYRKKIGDAVFNLGIDYDMSRQQRDAVSAALEIVNERHVLDDTRLAYLNELEADPSTIIVTGNDASIVYTSGLDYTLVNNPSGRTEIRRLPGGGIISGQPVLVSYRVSRNPSYSLREALSGYRAGFDCLDSRLRVYHHYSQKRFGDVQGAEGLILDAYNEALWGTEIDAFLMQNRLEYEQYDSDRSPFTAVRLSHLLPIRPFSRLEILLSAREDFVDFAESTRDARDLRAVMTCHLSRTTDYHFEAGQLRQKGGGLDMNRRILRNSFRKQLNRSFLEVGYDFEHEIWVGQDRRNHYIYSNFKRTF